MKTHSFLLFLFLLGCAPAAQLGSSSQTIDPREYPRDAHSGILIGDVAPDFSVIDIEGTTRTLSNNEGKPLLLLFIATWCPYCHQDLTALSKVYAAYPGVTIIAIDLDLKENNEDLRKYKAKYPGLEQVPFARGNEQILRDYNIRLTTTKYAIGSNGKIVYAGSGAFKTEQWTILLDALKKS